MSYPGATLPDPDHDDQALIEAGYTPQLSRSLNYFASFGVPFSFMSALMGIFSTYAYVLGKAGTFGIWTWLLVFAGRMLTALIFAELSGRIPLTGAIYNWNARLLSPFAGWFTAWLLMIGYSIGNVALLAALMTPLQTLTGFTFSPNVIKVIGAGIILVQLVINLYGVRLAASLNKLAVVIEIATLLIFSALLLAVTMFYGHLRFDLIAAPPKDMSPYWPGFLMASLMGVWTMSGSETSSDLSEETVKARSVTPRAILTGLCAVGLLGFLFLMAVTLAIPDLGNVTNSADPLSVIVAARCGPVAMHILLGLVVMCMFATGLVGITVVSRVLFAVARDRNFIGAASVSRLLPNGSPAAALMLVAAFQIAVFLLAKDSLDLFGSSTILIVIVYGITVAGFAFGLKKIPVAKSFSLGRWRRLITFAAFAWCVLELLVLTVPKEFHMSALIAAGMAVLGLVFYRLSHRRAGRLPAA